MKIEPNDAYAKQSRKKILENSSRIYWLDEFQRSNGDSVKRDWIEREADSKFNGIVIGIDKHKVLFEGIQQKENIVSLHRLVSKSHFVEFTGEIQETRRSEMSIGVFLSGLSKGNREILYFGKKTDGSLGYMTTSADQKVSFHLSTSLQTPHKWDNYVHRLGIRKTPRRKNSYQLLYDGHVLHTIGLNTNKYQQLEIGFFAVGPKGSSCLFTLDNTKIVEVK